MKVRCRINYFLLFLHRHLTPFRYAVPSNPTAKRTPVSSPVDSPSFKRRPKLRFDDFQEPKISFLGHDPVFVTYTGQSPPRQPSIYLSSEGKSDTKALHQRRQWEESGQCS